MRKSIEAKSIIASLCLNLCIIFAPTLTNASECAGKSVAQCADSLAAKVDQLQTENSILLEKIKSAKKLIDQTRIDMLDRTDKINKKIDIIHDGKICTDKTIDHRIPTRPNWSVLQCDSGSYLKGIAFTHNGGQDYAYQEAVRITCCSLK